ncbi:heavy metal translocating P-type ATPase [Umezakia ovalisporum]|uniref:Heavy metal translocating P-type ATPase n=1 Tax=Umezakia ovalisporum FSS-43 TaxID=2740520 RepID=A0ABT6K020_9CYAN|nr:heavy metal translocating P-type ATPase [Umezakia ovalisporum]MDH6055707.1 heavy metal translocating P-type ATPase [Umezakia ovalisporum FSS-43]MDH6067276.1 heavy metal translocating P-type ATPase [Umezakia ovalisporum APH033B]MDH6069752.1 heavy metal translocating P-type ATPase [Umezakia ovalisporum CobakiLakeA]MDH6075515.1 heavy metal translocating P-type ATPase [Umezakia ovalisporum CS-1034]MDH6079100.1 heavy metal translocating P-type ATPase [Umezakia ovalisporum FSS-45]
MKIATNLGTSQGVGEKPKTTGIDYHIVHTIPGRVRFRVPMLAQHPHYAQNLQKLLESDSRISQIRINPSCSSVAIQYQLSNNKNPLIPPYVVDLLHQAKSRKSETKTQNIQETQDFGLKLPTFATALALLALGLPIPRAIIAATVALAALPTAQGAYTSITQQRKLNIDCLDFIAIALTSAQGNLITPALIITLHKIGDQMRDRTARVTENQAADLLNSLGHYAWVQQPDGQKKRIRATQIQPKDIVIAYPGEQISVDGQILKGTALIDQQKLTGESIPVLRQPGQMVYASTLVREGEIYIQTEGVGPDTRAGASIELVKQAPVHDTRMGNYAATIADKTILPALIFSGLVLATTRDPSRAASILTLDFVTGIRVSLPTTFLAALHHASRHGVLIRSGRALEKLAQVDTLVFDKTGTLTKGDIEIVEMQTIGERITTQRLLTLAAAAEQRLTHPAAEALVRHAQKQGIEILPRREFVYEIGLGVRAEIDGQQVIVGSDRFLRQCGITLDCLHHPPHDVNCRISAHDSLLYVSVNQELQGIIYYRDLLRPESTAVVEQLQTKYGMEIHLLTGDNQHRAIAVAQELNIPLCQVHAEAFPQQKAQIIQKIHTSGKTVAFTGDGLNDSIALAYADVAISFGGGSEVARETADVVLIDDNLTSFLEAIAIARQTEAIIKQNIGLAIIPNLAALGLTTTTGLHPLAATIIHNGSAIAAGLNGLRPLMHQDPPRPQGISSIPLTNQRALDILGT